MSTPEFFVKASLLTALLAMAVMSSAPTAAANDYPAVNEIQASEIAGVIDPFFSTLQSKAYAKAYADLFEGTLLAAKPMEIQNLVSQTGFLFETYGAISGWKIFASECAASTLCRVKILVSTTNGPVFYWLTLYRGDRGWQPTNILMGDTQDFAF